ncbi:unnamed protein product [Caretta caretta]
MDSAYNAIPLHSTIWWLSRSKVLVRFVNWFDAIKAFLSEKGQNYPRLDDDKWLCKLMFLTDITAHLNKLNLRLQGAGQTVLGGSRRCPGYWGGDPFWGSQDAWNESLSRAHSGREPCLCPPGDALPSLRLLAARVLRSGLRDLALSLCRLPSDTPHLVTLEAPSPSHGSSAPQVTGYDSAYLSTLSLVPGTQPGL